MANESPVSHSRHLFPNPATQVIGVGAVSVGVIYTKPR